MTMLPNAACPVRRARSVRLVPRAAAAAIAALALLAWGGIAPPNALAEDAPASKDAPRFAETAETAEATEEAPAAADNSGRALRCRMFLLTKLDMELDLEAVKAHGDKIGVESELSKGDEPAPGDWLALRYMGTDELDVYLFRDGRAGVAFEELDLRLDTLHKGYGSFKYAVDFLVAETRDDIRHDTAWQAWFDELALYYPDAERVYHRISFPFKPETFQGTFNLPSCELLEAKLYLFSNKTWRRNFQLGPDNYKTVHGMNVFDLTEPFKRGINYFSLPINCELASFEFVTAAPPKGQFFIITRDHERAGKAMLPPKDIRTLDFAFLYE